MPEPTPQTFHHFSLVSFTDRYWSERADDRRRIHRDWLERLKGSVDALHLYQTFGAETQSDLLVWSAIGRSDPDVPAHFLAAFAGIIAPQRPFLSVREVLWGFTGPSQYTKTRSTQELDPFTPGRRRYLVMYPFVKTAEWYLKEQGERQRMMAAHIKLGKQYPEITQLLLYSLGLQDQEFVVVYETDDLAKFSSLVTDLRQTEARRYTERDSPLHTALYQSDLDALARWL